MKKQTMTKQIICIDPGHGMSNRRPGVYDPGAIGPDGYNEAEAVLTYGLTLGEIITQRGWNAAYTRDTSHESSPLNRRVARAKIMHAEVLISLHLNASAQPGTAATDGRVKGLEIYYRDELSRQLASAINTRLAWATHHAKEPIKNGRLIILEFSPSCLIEIGFIDDPDDLTLIRTPEWRNKFCESIEEGMNEWRKQH